MTSLADRLRAAIDETARIAQAAGGTAWRRTTTYPDQAGVEEATTGEVVVYDEGFPTVAQAEHIARHDPAAVLRRCAADRKILDAYEHADRVAGSGISPEGNYANGLEFAVREIAEAYGVEA